MFVFSTSRGLKGNERRKGVTWCKWQCATVRLFWILYNKSIFQNFSTILSFKAAQKYSYSILPNKYSFRCFLSSQSSDKQEKARKPKRGSSNSQPALPQIQSQTQQQQSQPVSSVVTSVSSSAVVTTSKRGGRSNHQTPPPAVTVAPVPSIIQGPTLSGGHFSNISSGSANNMGPTVKESPPSSPGSESMSSSGPGRKKRKSASAASITPTPSASSTPTLTNPKEEKDIKL